MSKNWNLESVPFQNGRTAIVTGANVGLGFETAKVLAAKGFALDKSVKGGEYYGTDGWMEMRGKPTVVDSTRLSKNREIAEKLWEVSEKLVEIKYSF